MSAITEAMVHRIADEVREKLQVESSSDRHALGQRSNRLDGVDALEEALTAALAASSSGSGDPADTLRAMVARQTHLDPDAAKVLHDNLWSLYQSEPAAPGSAPGDRDTGEALLQVRDLALGASLRDDHLRHVEVLASRLTDGNCSACNARPVERWQKHPNGSLREFCTGCYVDELEELLAATGSAPGDRERLWAHEAAAREATGIITAMQSALTTAYSALENWGRHFEWCAVRQTVTGPCDCGLAAAINAKHAEFGSVGAGSSGEGARG